MMAQVWNRVEKETAEALTPVEPALSVENVSHAYGARLALDDVSFTVPCGSFTVLLGLNGAGKSTLFSLITRLYQIRQGVIRVLGHELQREPGEALRRLGVVFQARTLDLDLSVVQNLAYHAALHARRLADESLRRLDLAGKMRDKVRSLSGGQMRRVEIARALLHRPQLLLLDEATVGLDIRSRADMVRHVRRLVAEENCGVLWATHLIDEVGPEDDVVVLHHGKVLASGRVEQVVADVGAEDIRSAFAMLTGAGAPRTASGVAA
jgi:ABC-2 type transport system ATP-binding protein